MKRIYLLLLFVVVAATNSFGRNVDMRVNHYIGNAGSSSAVHIIKDGDQIFSNGDTSSAAGHNHVRYKFIFEFTCLSAGADSMIASDTLWLKSAFSSVIRGWYGVHLKQNDSFSYTRDSVWFLPGSLTTSGSQTVNACDSIWLEDASHTTVPDPNLANNRTCANMTYAYFATEINNLQVNHNEIILFPNPATKKLSLLYNFENGAKGANVVITDAAGRVVLTQDLGRNLYGSQEITLNNISSLNAGMYFLQVRTDEGKTALSKFTIE